MNKLKIFLKPSWIHVIIFIIVIASYVSAFWWSGGYVIRIPIFDWLIIVSSLLFLGFSGFITGNKDIVGLNLLGLGHTPPIVVVITAILVIIFWYLVSSCVAGIIKKAKEGNDPNSKSAKVVKEIKILIITGVIAYITIKTSLLAGATVTGLKSVTNSIITLFFFAFVIEFIRAIYATIYDRAHKNKPQQEISE